MRSMIHGYCHVDTHFVFSACFSKLTPSELPISSRAAVSVAHNGTYHEDGIEKLPTNVVVEGLQAQLQIIRKDRDRVAGQLAALRQTTDNLARDLADSKANEIEAQAEAARCKEKLDKLRTSHETIQRASSRAEIVTSAKAGEQHAAYQREDVAGSSCKRERTRREP
jgi:outer membrane murein-binding lipoprotein Lpp